MNRKLVQQSLMSLAGGAMFALLLYKGVSKEVLHRFLPHSKSEQYIFILSGMVAPFLALVMHELGHLCAGLLQDFRLELFIVGFLGLKRDGNRVRLFFNKNIHYFGGLAATVPTRYYSDIRTRFARILLAGPLVSLALGIVSLFIFQCNNTPFHSFWALLGLTSLSVFLGTTLPDKTGVFFTDRKRFQRLMDPGVTGEIELALLETMNQFYIDNRYSQLSLEKLGRIKADTDTFVSFWGNFYEFQYHKELGHDELSQQIRAKLFTFKKDVPKSIWQSLQID